MTDEIVKEIGKLAHKIVLNAAEIEADKEGASLPMVAKTVFTLHASIVTSMFRKDAWQKAFDSLDDAIYCVVDEFLKHQEDKK